MGKKTTVQKFTAFFILLLFTGTFLMATQGVNEELQITEEITHISCPGNATGEIRVTASGGLIPYTFSWEDSEGNPLNGSSEGDQSVLTGLAAGTYHLTVTDNSDPQQTTSAEYVVLEEDEISPEISTPEDLTLSPPSGECAVVIEDLEEPSTTDNCSTVEVIGSRNDGEALTAPYPLGQTTITWTATDEAGNTAAPVDQYIFVVSQDPSMTAPSDISLNISNNTEECATVVELGSPEIQDPCGEFEIVPLVDDEPINPETHLFSTGTTLVSWTATDQFGNTFTDVQQVQIFEDEAPVIGALENITIPTDPGSCVVTNIILQAPAADDNCGEVLVTNNAPEEFTLGATEVTWTVTDQSGNIAQATQTVNVEDRTPPVVITETISIYLDSKGEAVFTSDDIEQLTSSSYDNCELESVIIDPTTDFNSSFTCADIGTIQVPLIATDLSGNSSEVTYGEVQVRDTIAPVLPALERIEAENDLNSCYASVDLVIPEATDNCGAVSVIGTRNDGEPLSAPYPIGTTTITWTATDISGNTTSMAQVVNVEDLEAPLGNELPVIQTSCTYTFTPPTTTDNCTLEGTITATTDDPLTYYAQNSFTRDTITWKFEDRYGNISEVKQVVEITPLFADFSYTSVTCSGGADGTIEIAAEGGKQPFTYALDDAAYGSSPIFTGLSEGSYTAKIKDANGCIVYEHITITEPDPLHLETTEDPITTTAETCYGASNGIIHISGELSGGNGNYQYSVDNENFFSTPEITGLTAGEYEIYIQDTNGCRLNQTLFATIEGPEAMAAKVTPFPVSCFETSTGKIEITDPTGGNAQPYSFRINNQTWQENTSQGVAFTGLERGNYNVEMRDANGCVTSLGIFEVTQPSPLEATVETTKTTTYGSATGTATATAMGGNGSYSYEWQNKDGRTVGNTQTVTGLVAGLYNLIVKDAKGCTFVKEVEIFDLVTVDINATSICMDIDDSIRTSTFTIDLDQVRGGEGDPINYTYSWDFGDGASLPPGTTGRGVHEVQYEFAGEKMVTLTVTDEADNTSSHTFGHYVGECFEACTSSENFSSDNNSFYLGDKDGNKMDSTNCDDEEPMYLWFIVNKSSNGYKLYSEFIYTVKSGNTTKEYRATNCYENEDGSQLRQGQLVRLNQVGPEDDQIHWKCDEILSIIHITYKWTNNASKSCGDTAQNMCASTNDVIAVATPVRASIESSNTCYGERNGSIIVRASGGAGVLEYDALNTTTNESFVSTTGAFNNLPAGDYTVNVTDTKEVAGTQEKAVYTLTTSIEEPAEQLLANVATENIIMPSCNGATDGSATVTASGGTGEYTYLWNDSRGQRTATANNLGAGTYTVTVTDTNNCTATKTVEITEPTKLTTANAGADKISCGFTTTTLQANTPTNGIGRWSVISGPDQGNIEDPTNPVTNFTGTEGDYVLRWTISNEEETCLSTSDIAVTIIGDCNFLDFDGVDDYIDFGNNYNLDSSTFSLEAWVKLKTTTGTRTVLSKRNGSTNNSPGFELVIGQGGTPSFRWGNFSLSPDASSPLNTQRWYHLAVTFDGTSTRLYVDGIQVKKDELGAPASTTAPFLIGATYNSNTASLTKAGSHFHGWIEEVRIWKKALTTEQLRFMMNQRLENNNGNVKGTEIPLDVPGPLPWNALNGYYRLLSDEAATGDGTTIDRATEQINGALKNITTFQENSAPLPYETKRDGKWRDIANVSTPWIYGQGRWDAPNSTGINSQPIEWNIVKTSHALSSENSNITLLGLISESGILRMSDPNRSQDEYNRGHSLRVTHYLDLDGAIDLAGESQLLQDEGSILDEESTGYILRGQQGTASSYNYNYWSSPVSTQGAPNNSGYSIAGVLRDGTDPENPGPISFNYAHTWADNIYTGPKRISSYWLNIYTNNISGTYSQWEHVGQNGHIQAGEGYTMKGTSGSAEITDPQNYIFMGKPNNGTIKLQVDPGNDYLVGNPYPSALDGYEFIKDNIEERRDGNIFNGSLYFWDHFSGKTHYLKQYVGGYATLNLSGGVVAVATDARINATGEFGDPEKIPQQFIPVGQAFYVSTNLAEQLYDLVSISGGDIIFKNSQRAFETDDQEEDESVFKTKEEKEAELRKKDQRQKIYFNFSSPGGFHRQLLVTKDEATTSGFDLGYDAPLIDNVEEDMYWIIQDVKFVIQGVPDFSKDRVLPLGVKLKNDGEISIGLGVLQNIPEKFNIYLKDSLRDTIHNLRTSDYITHASAGNTEDRFAVVFQKEALEEEDPDPDDPDEEGNEGTEQEGEDNTDNSTEEPEEGSSNEEDQNTEEAEETGEDLPQDIGIIFLQGNQELIIHNPDFKQIKQVRLLNILGQEMKVFPSQSSNERQRFSLRALNNGTYIVEVQTLGKKYNKIIILTK